MSYLFTEEQGNLLIRLLLAHIAADFILQPKTTVETKPWFSKYMAFHTTIVFVLTFVLTFSWKLTILISVTHWLIDSVRQNLQNKYPTKEYLFFPIGQLLHLGVIFVLWSYTFTVFDACLKVIKLPFFDYQLSLYVLGYVLVIWPLGYLIKLGLEKMELFNVPINKNSKQQTLSISIDDHTEDKNTNVKNAGKRIGQFERIIILTFVLLNQYEAIGFLITGKSIIRFAQKDENLKSEYVLVGTMMSYALSILIGLGIKWLM